MENCRSYFLFGEEFACALDLAIPEKSMGRVPVRIEIHRAAKNPTGHSAQILDANRASLNVPDEATYVFDRKQRKLEVHCTTPNAVGILNHAVPFALAVQGELLVHATAIESAKGATLFMGRRGVGKSHLAAMAASRGRKILSDDFVRIGRDRQVFPSFPEIRLFPEDVAAFPKLTVTAEAGPKTRLSAVSSFYHAPLPLERLFHLVQSGEAGPLSALEGFQALMENTLFYPCFEKEMLERRWDLIYGVCRDFLIEKVQAGVGRTDADIQRRIFENLG